MSKFFALLMVIFSLTVAETALAGDWRGNGGHGRWSHPHAVYNGGWGNHHGGYHGGRHHGGHHGDRDLWIGLGIGAVAGAILSQPQQPMYYSSPQPVYRPQRCWTEWRPAYGLYDRYGNQLGQTFTFCQ